MVSFTFCLKRAPRLFSTQIHAPSRTPKRLQSSGLTMMSGSGWNSRMVGSWRCSEWKNSKERPPPERMSGNSSKVLGVESGLSGGSMW